MPSAGSTNEPPSQPTVFIDRNSGGRAFKALLERAGLTVVLHDEQFAPKTTDEAWIQEVGQRGWLAVTGDNAITRSAIALHHIRHSRLHLFILHGLNGATADGKAQCIINASAQMQRLADAHVPPAIWRIGSDEVARRFDFRPILARKRRG
jgi:hypothetical protein